MTALYRGGRQAEALAAYHQGREVLMDQLGLGRARRFAGSRARPST